MTLLYYYPSVGYIIYTLREGRTYFFPEPNQQMIRFEPAAHRGLVKVQVHSVPMPT